MLNRIEWFFFSNNKINFNIIVCYWWNFFGKLLFWNWFFCHFLLKIVLKLTFFAILKKNCFEIDSKIQNFKKMYWNWLKKNKIVNKNWNWLKNWNLKKNNVCYWKKLNSLIKILVPDIGHCLLSLYLKELLEKESMF